MITIDFDKWHSYRNNGDDKINKVSSFSIKYRINQRLHRVSFEGRLFGLLSIMLGFIHLELAEKS